MEPPLPTYIAHPTEVEFSARIQSTITQQPRSFILGIMGSTHPLQTSLRLALEPSPSLFVLERVSVNILYNVGNIIHVSGDFTTATRCPLKFTDPTL